ncbi:MAG: DUF2141 domain-containing protein [Pseudomonadota bacterium]
MAQRARRVMGRPVMGRISLVTGLAVLCAPMPASIGLAAELVVTITEVRSADGLVSVALCPEADFLTPLCPFNATAPAAEGELEVVFEDIPPGEYGVQGYHDANANGEMDRNMVGWPLEGFAFANDPTILLRAPKFEAASIVVGEEDLRTTMTMRYR